MEIFEQIAQLTKPNNGHDRALPKKVKLAMDIIMQTSAYKLGQIVIIIEPEGDGIRCYSAPSNDTPFYNPGFIGILELLNINSYVSYDAEKQQCYLKIL
jgi:hypothetical protein